MNEVKVARNAKTVSFFKQFDCLDIGADTNTIEWAKKSLGAVKPLGINIEKVRLDRMREAGMDCVDMNSFDIPLDIKPDYVVMGHFLEHLNSRDEVIDMVTRACNWAQKAVFINGPFFEDDDYIRSYGVKFAWGDWIDHVGRFGISHFLSMLIDRFPRADLAVSVGFPSLDSSKDNILALAEASNKGSYEKQGTVTKPVVTFARPAFAEFAVVIRKSPEIDITGMSVSRHGKPGMAAWRLLQMQAHEELRALYT